MITADQLDNLTSVTPNMLARFLHNSGYKDTIFKTATFVGITNGGQFAYRVTFKDEHGTGKDSVGKVFLTYDHATSTISADY